MKYPHAFEETDGEIAFSTIIADKSNDRSAIGIKVVERVSKMCILTATIIAFPFK
jgi:hypothetical protein